MNELVTDLRDKLQRPLPGAPAQYKMAHQVRQYAPKPPAHARRAGVLALFYPKAGDVHLVLIRRRSGHANDRHAGQVSFPGGAHESGDATLSHTALRETEEEVGAPISDIELLGPLSPLYIPVSNFLVYPYVGQLDFQPQFQPDYSEVEYIIEVPLAVLQDPTNVRKTDLPITKQLILRDVPYFAVDDHVVWGATAMMLSELLTVLSE